MLKCSRRYGSGSKTKLLIGVVFKISDDKLSSGHLRINVHSRFDLESENIKISNVNLQSCSLDPCPVLTSDLIHPLLFIRIQLWLLIPLKWKLVQI